MELRHLRYFIAVAEELNFTRAAQRLHIAQPPLSTQIRALEEEIGARLFERDKRRVFLTQAGERMLVRARQILAAANEAKSEARNAAAGRTAKIDFGYTASAMFTQRLPAAIRSYQASHPEVQLTLHEMTSLEQLHAVDARELDIAVLRNSNLRAPAGVKVEEWYREPLLAALPADHPLARGRSVKVIQLNDQPLIVYPRESGIGLYWKVQELCTRAGFRPHVAREVREASTMIGLVSAGVGIAIVPFDLRCVALPGVVYRPLAGPEAMSALHLSFRAADRDPHVLALLALLRVPPPFSKQSMGS